jgi:hypothetical protein
MNRQPLTFDRSCRVRDLFEALRQKRGYGICQSFRIAGDRIRLIVSRAQICGWSGLTDTLSYLIRQFLTHLSETIDFSLITRP